jgi:hypothetical protein
VPFVLLTSLFTSPSYPNLQKPVRVLCEPRRLGSAETALCRTNARRAQLKGLSGANRAQRELNKATFTIPCYLNLQRTVNVLWKLWKLWKLFFQRPINIGLSEGENTGKHMRLTGYVKSDVPDCATMAA